MMFRRIATGIVVILALGTSTVRLPAASCILTNTPGEKACKPGCCANKTCCRTSEQRTGAPVQPLAKSGAHQLPIVALAIASAVTLPLGCATAEGVRPHTDSAGKSPPRQAVLCTFLI